MTDVSQRVDPYFVRLRTDLTPQMWRAARDAARERLCLPEVDGKALDGLKFSTALPRHLAEATLAARLADLDGAHLLLEEPQRFTRPVP
ncbi:hypothetical protein [Thermomonospora catenispora]|uniref:hypothetical protein n=1 Tax=Thermomonospora catenispora TaxID=2493090 RepID=UPI00111F4BC0|nr:hypothetical protein [Thermomonospora catenispora]TNY35933.1 hypothetical protein EIO00_15735 [Thermomonospora catenispora]